MVSDPISTAKNDSSTDDSFDHLSPGMQQYMRVKTQHPDCIVFFRMGDFYETFYQDAKTVARELDITLTSRGKGEKKAPLAGIPYHSVQPYLGKLVAKGYKVCIVEQMEDPKYAKGLVKRDIVRIVTPGTVIDDTILTQKMNNYLMAINKEKDSIGVAFCDVSTGEFCTFSTDITSFHAEVTKYQPKEILIPLSLEQSSFAKTLSTLMTLSNGQGSFVNYYDDTHFFVEKATTLLKKQFSLTSWRDPLELSCVGAVLSYLYETQRSDLSHIKQLRAINTSDFMLLDQTTLSNLNIISNRRDDKATLLSVLDSTSTSMGSRLLRSWVLRPLIDRDALIERQNAVAELLENMLLCEGVRKHLGSVIDVERLISRISFKTASPKDLVGLRDTLRMIPELNALISSAQVSSTLISTPLPLLSEILTLLSSAIKDEPNTITREGNMIREGYNAELDELHLVKRDSKQWLLQFEEEEKRKTGMKFLRVSFNKVFGYFIEVSNSNLNLVPSNYIRKQTQVNGERFITPELKEKENIILTADERINLLEYKLFMDILAKLEEKMVDLSSLSLGLSQLDVLSSFAVNARNRNYVKPSLHDGFDVIIKDGRHPIVETIESRFISNDLIMNETTKMMIITGPNMAGKSVYIKQNALIILMAQIGSFVPASSASIGVVDRIFSRVGASDDIASGMSTFMVEMDETAKILSNATDKSFIILDEIGRGTSTYDGVSLAWAIAEHIATTICAKTLFATHYHHLNKMAGEYSTIQNFNIAVSERDDSIIFLRKIVHGGTDKSYGIHVAKLAGFPPRVIESAKKIITQLEMEDEIGEMLHKGIKVDGLTLSEKEKSISVSSVEKIDTVAIKGKGQKTLLDL